MIPPLWVELAYFFKARFESGSPRVEFPVRERESQWRNYCWHQQICRCCGERA